MYSNNLSKTLTNFFLAIAELSNENLITKKQKLSLKQSLISQDNEIKQLLNGCEDKDLDQMKKDISLYLKQCKEKQRFDYDESEQKNILGDSYLKISNISHAKSMPVTQEILAKKKYNLKMDLLNQDSQQESLFQQSKTSQFQDSDIFDTSEKFEKSLIQMISEKGLSFSLFEKKKLQKVKKLIGQILEDNLQGSPTAKSIPSSPIKFQQTVSPSNHKNRTMELQLEESLQNIKYRFKDLKHFMSEVYGQLVQIMEENIQFSTLKKVLKDLGNIFFGIHEFSFIAEDDAFITDINKQLNKLKTNEFFDFSEEELNKVIQVDCYKTNIAMKFKQSNWNILFVMHSHKQDKDSFLRYINPLASGSIILDISSKLLNRLHVLLKDIIIEVLQEKLEQTILLTESEEQLVQQGGKLLFSINDLLNKRQYYFGTAENIFLPKTIDLVRFKIEFYFRNSEGVSDGFIIVINELELSNYDSGNFRERMSFSAKSSSHKDLSESNGLITLNSIDEKQELSLEQQKYVQSKMQKVVSFQETIRYIQDLKKQEPGVGDSQLQMFFPSDLKKEGKNNLSSLIMSRFKTKQISRKKRKYSSEQQVQGISPSKKKEGIPFQIKYDTSIFIHKEEDKELQSLDWNALELQTTKEMHRTAWRVFDQAGWIEKYQIPLDTFIEFLMEIERKYNKRKNPFHNYLHGIAVMQCAFTLSKCKMISKYLDDFKQFVLTFSGLCHDISHRARTNIFMVNSMDKLAIRYNDDSVLERHHIATTFLLLQDDRYNIFKNMPLDQFKELRKLAISNILYTDISKHFPLMKDFSKTFKVPEDQNKQTLSVDQNSSDFEQPQAPVFGSGTDDLIYLQGTILHTADFTGGAKPFPISRIWSERVNQEFTAQYIEEGKRGLPQTPFFKDLDKPHIAAKGEIGFFKFIVQPLWDLLNEFTEGELNTNQRYMQQQ
ncbi:hypothetical protein PPERSA_03519 [Pseudocohnilembus persalinus]|uniref:Phosphodiesterase n=1 Tax=Pseudocohnilembus persalinus TaxID=266149 RepID=A0A0V0R375_PSEPJ|nr:hypothetical protein PPERSA_03519 [Pseudocohnilembus persalinus]|eukprot:KRX08648.1 hypothetical protein PPERSA_03519 [Pseudocohnilembus persalinus]